MPSDQGNGYWGEYEGMNEYLDTDQQTLLGWHQLLTFEVLFVADLSPTLTMLLVFIWHTKHCSKNKETFGWGHSELQHANYCPITNVFFNDYQNWIIRIFLILEITCTYYELQDCRDCEFPLRAMPVVRLVHFA